MIGSRHRRGEQHSIPEYAPILQFAPKPIQIVDVELHRTADPEAPEVTGWVARWGLHDSDRSSEDHDEDLAELIRAILADLAPLAEFYTDPGLAARR